MTWDRSGETPSHLAQTFPGPNHFFVYQDVSDCRHHAANVVARHQRGGQNAPKTEVRAVFIFSHAAIADFEHVRIVPSACRHRLAAQGSKPNQGLLGKAIDNAVSTLIVMYLLPLAWKTQFSLAPA